MFLKSLIALALVAACALALEAALEWRDARAVPFRGRMVDAGGRRVRVLVSGAGQAGPTVILECGIGGATAANWGWIQRGVERFAPVFAYDRAGLGWSEPGPLPRDGARMVEELHAALAASGHRAPFVFVGHSYGGLLARLYVDRYPDEVVGLVLLDSSHPRQFGQGSPPPSFLRVARALLGAAPMASHLGLMRLIVSVIPMDARHLPQPERREQMAFLARASHWRGTQAEMRSWMPLTNDEAARTKGFGDRPLVVISADHGHWAGWADMQRDLASLSTRGIQETEPGATHAGLLSDSAYAARAVQAIRAVRDAALAGGPVALPPRGASR